MTQKQLELAFQEGDQPDAAVSVLALLRRFGRDHTNFVSDKAKVGLLTQYLFVQAIVPELSFEAFLRRYAVLADDSKEKPLRPDTAITAALGDKTAAKKWSQKEIVEFVAVYVDMIRAAEQEGVPVPMTLHQCLTNPKMIEAFLSGQFAEDPEPEVKKKRNKPPTPATADKPLVPWVAGSRAIYHAASGQQFRGQVQSVQTTEAGEFADFVSDAGELFRDIGTFALKPCDAAQANVLRKQSGDEAELLGRKVIRVARDRLEKIQRYLATGKPVGTVAPGGILDEFFEAVNDHVVAVIQVCNGVNNVYVDARLSTRNPDGTPGGTLFDIAPRTTFEGTYTFHTPQGAWQVSVCSR